MVTVNEFHSEKVTARIAGLWYLLLAITAGFSWTYITKTFIPSDAVQTVTNILTTEKQFILSIICNIIGQISFVFLVLLLYKLLKNANEFQAKLMLIFALISVPIMFINTIFQTGSLIILTRSNYLKITTLDQIKEFVTILLHFSIIGIYIVDIFWGLWLFPLAYLVYKSNLFPKIISIVLIISGLGYLIESITFIIFPEIHTIIRSFLSIPESLGELVMLLWLLIRGVSIQEKKSKT